MYDASFILLRHSAKLAIDCSLVLDGHASWNHRQGNLAAFHSANSELAAANLTDVADNDRLRYSHA